jgi:hypothetical protein
MGMNSPYGSLNFGASWKFASKISVVAGYDIYNNSDLVNTFTIQGDIDI